MSEFKLQIGAMIAVLYYIVLSVREGSIRRKQRCSKIFDMLLFIAPWAVLLDGAGAQFDPNLVTIFLDARDEIVSFCVQNKVD